MADVRAFPALRYTTRDLEPLLAPPYDVLSEAEVAAFQTRSPYNVVRLTRPGGDYEGAARLFQEWIASGVVAEAGAPAMFVHETTFAAPDANGHGGPARSRTRLDLLAALRLQPYDDGVILPHERTHRGPKEDRLALLRATGVSFEPLWFLVEGLRELLEGAPTGEVLEFAHAGERHRLRAVADASWTAAVNSALAPRQVLIADGHHRYETTLAYSEELGGGSDSSARFTLALLTDLEDPGLVVLPTHRVLKSGVAVSGGEPAGSLEQTLAGIDHRVAAGYFRDGSFQVLPLEGEVPVVELHRQVVDNILGRMSAEEALTYTRDAAEAVRMVEEGRGVAAFLLQAPDLQAVLRLARQGMTMPQKATYFYPKPPSGMVFHRLDPGRNLESRN
ncbi:MAG: DUF1015 domain-containing protein [Candidatus Dormibacteraeota bacterium]|nr:DUF1015 domain-containing protein [Candidatus Dormibacteraeota bacterium]